MREKLRQYMQNRLNEYVFKSKQSGKLLVDQDTIAKKQKMHENRGAEIVKCAAAGKIHSMNKVGDQTGVLYEVNVRYLIKMGEVLYLEEEADQRFTLWEGEEVVEDSSINDEGVGASPLVIPPMEEEEDWNRDIRFTYNRMEAVLYAEQWWNSYNPQFKKFEVDCTNYISQCLYAGGAPMVGYPNKSRGWWMRNKDWSYTWSVAHSLRWYIPSAKAGMKGREVAQASLLKPGDVICYDFQGDGRFDHNTIVVAKDQNGEPLVNAHTTNSRMRYWAYEDSTAYTPNIKYKFFHIIDRN